MNKAFLVLNSPSYLQLWRAWRNPCRDPEYLECWTPALESAKHQCHATPPQFLAVTTMTTITGSHNLRKSKIPTSFERSRVKAMCSYKSAPVTMTGFNKPVLLRQ